MASSGIEWIDWTFDTSVRALYTSAHWLGITYEEINVWLFCIVWPLSMIGAAVWIWWLARANKMLARSGPTPNSKPARGE